MNMQNSLMDKEINFESLYEYLKNRYPGLEYLLDRDIEKECGMLQIFLDELNFRNFRKISEVHKALVRTKEAVEQFEIESPPEGIGRKYSPTCIARISMRLLDSNFFPYRKIPAFDDIPQEKLEEYRKHILPE
jgi:hypothetical protein